MIREMKKNCEVCGKEYIGWLRSKYCSDECRYESKNCKQCGEKFLVKNLSKNGSNEYCCVECWYEWEREQSKVVCPQCNKTFKLNRKNQKYCSRKCADKSYRSNNRNTHCEYCDGLLREDCNAKTRFCSKECSAKSNPRIIHQSKPIGTISNAASGYKQIKTEDGWILHHRYVMEQKLGRKLLKHERIHHKNGIRDDNRPENLELWCVTKKDPPGQRMKDLCKLIAQQPEFKDLDEQDVINAITRILCKNEE